MFAGFAVYLWYRLVRDAVEREREEAAEAGAGRTEGATGGRRRIPERFRLGRTAAGVAASGAMMGV